MTDPTITVVVPTPYVSAFVGNTFRSVTVRKNGLDVTVNSPRTIYAGQNGITVRSNLARQTVRHADSIVSAVDFGGNIVEGPK